MRKITLFILIAIIGLSIFSEEDSVRPVGLDAGGFISYGYFEPDSNSTEDQVMGALASLFSVRGGLSASLRYRMSSMLSAGLEVGYATMNVEIAGTEVVFHDFPFNALVRFGKKGTFIEAHGGYYYSDLVYSGISAGAKASLGGVYVDYTYIWGDQLVYPRITLGFQVNDII